MITDFFLVLSVLNEQHFFNLTYCCQQTTVITDFSDLEQIGKDHTMTLNGGAMPMDQYQAVNGKEAALQLINGGRGVITPYGVAYDNGMELEPVYKCPISILPRSRSSGPARWIW